MTSVGLVFVVCSSAPPAISPPLTSLPRARRLLVAVGPRGMAARIPVAEWRMATSSEVRARLSILRHAPSLRFDLPRRIPLPPSLPASPPPPLFHSSAFRSSPSSAMSFYSVRSAARPFVCLPASVTLLVLRRSTAAVHQRRVRRPYTFGLIQVLCRRHGVGRDRVLNERANDH